MSSISFHESALMPYSPFGPRSPGAYPAPILGRYDVRAVRITKEIMPAFVLDASLNHGRHKMSAARAGASGPVGCRISGGRFVGSQDRTNCGTRAAPVTGARVSGTRPSDSQTAISQP